MTRRVKGRAANFNCRFMIRHCQCLQPCSAAFTTLLPVPADTTCTKMWQFCMLSETIPRPSYAQVWELLRTCQQTCLTRSIVYVNSSVLLLGPMQQVTRYKQYNIQLRGVRWPLGVHTNCMMSGSHCKPHTLPEDAMEMSSCGEEEASSRTMLKAVAGMLSVFAAGRQPAGP